MWHEYHVIDNKAKNVVLQFCNRSGDYSFRTFYVIFSETRICFNTVSIHTHIRIAETRGLFNLLQSPACIHMIADWPVMQESIRIGPGTHARTTNRDKD